MLNDYELSYPGKIVFGAGKRHELKNFLPKGPVLVICGKHSKELVRLELIPELAPRPVAVFGSVSTEPPIADVEKALALGRENNAKSVIGIGGGSAMDTAKTVAAMMNLPGTVEDYFYNRRKISRSGTFFAALPTTAGTGAEITSNAVLTDPENHLKQSVRHASMAADLALVDPELTWNAPFSVTAGSGFDAITQAIESCISRKATVPSRALAEAAFAEMFPALEKACRNDHAAREAMAEGSMLTAMAFAQSGLGAVHGIGHPAGSILHVPHGVCCAILLPEVLRWNCDPAREELDNLAKLAGLSSATNLIAALENLRETLHLPGNFRSYGLAGNHYDFIVKNCRSGSMKANIRELSDDDVKQILDHLK